MSEQGVDFDSLDGQRTYILFLLLSHPGRSAEHLRALERVVSQLRDDVFCRLLRQCSTADEIRELLDEADEWQVVRSDRFEMSSNLQSVAAQ